MMQKYKVVIHSKVVILMKESDLPPECHPSWTISFDSISNEAKPRASVRHHNLLSYSIRVLALNTYLKRDSASSALCLKLKCCSFVIPQFCMLSLSNSFSHSFFTSTMQTRIQVTSGAFLSFPALYVLLREFFLLIASICSLDSHATKWRIQGQ